MNGDESFSAHVEKLKPFRSRRGNVFAQRGVENVIVDTNTGDYLIHDYENDNFDVVQPIVLHRSPATNVWRVQSEVTPTVVTPSVVTPPRAVSPVIHHPTVHPTGLVRSASVNIPCVPGVSQQLQSRATRTKPVIPPSSLTLRSHKP